MLVFATGAVVVRNILNQPAAVTETAKESPAPQVRETAQPVDAVTPVVPDIRTQDVVALAPNNRPQGNKTQRRAGGVSN